jgi:hypothetical protein
MNTVIIYKNDKFIFKRIRHERQLKNKNIKFANNSKRLVTYKRIDQPMKFITKKNAE